LASSAEPVPADIELLLVLPEDAILVVPRRQPE
jgi:hypothetical protein